MIGNDMSEYALTQNIGLSSEWIKNTNLTSGIIYSDWSKKNVQNV